jgi:hypothetical protein
LTRYAISLYILGTYLLVVAIGGSRRITSFLILKDVPDLNIFNNVSSLRDLPSLLK